MLEYNKYVCFSRKFCKWVTVESDNDFSEKYIKLSQVYSNCFMKPVESPPAGCQCGVAALQCCLRLSDLKRRPYFITMGFFFALFGRWAGLSGCFFPGWRCFLTLGSCCRYFWRSCWIFQLLVKDSWWQLSCWVLWSKAAVLRGDGSVPCRRTDTVSRWQELRFLPLVSSLLRPRWEHATRLLWGWNLGPRQCSEHGREEIHNDFLYPVWSIQPIRTYLLDRKWSPGCLTWLVLDSGVGRGF